MTARFGPFTLDADARQLTHDANGVVHLTPKAFDLLVLLIGESPKVVRKAALHERLWPGTFVSDATLVGLIKELRRALDDRHASSPIIRTAHGVGYAFAADLERHVARPSPVSWWIVAGTRRIPLSGGENLIGRDPAAAVWLDAAGVSRRHARIVIGEDEAVLEDLQSKNGTSVNGQAVNGSHRLRDGDRIQAGPILFMFHVSSSGISTETLSHTARGR